MFKTLLVQAHNLTQMAGWGFLLVLTLLNLRDAQGALTFNQYWTVPGYRSKLELFQSLQVLDVLFSLVGLTNNSVFATFP